MLLGGAGGTTATVIVVLAGVGVAAFSLYLLVLAVAALVRPRLPDSSSAPVATVTVIVPAHDEERLVARCVTSLREQSYPAELYEIVVIADNCTDRTADVASAAGARVLVRTEPSLRGKGHAISWALEQLLAETPPSDAFAIVDADSIATPGFLATLTAPLSRGAQAVQGESLLYEDGSTASALRSAAFLLVNRVRPTGRAAFGLPCGLGGNGMLFRRELLLAHPWTAFTSAEDVEYAVHLRKAGIGPVFARGAVLESPAPPNASAAATQQLRWEGGKLHLARTHVPSLVAGAIRERRPALLDVAFELALPPLGYLAAAVGGLVVATGVLAAEDVVPAWTVAPSASALVALPAFVLVGLRAADAPPSAYRALLSAPAFVVGKVSRMHRVVRFRAETWVRTERAVDPDEPPREA